MNLPTSWENFPVGDYLSKASVYRFFIQPWLAIRERYWALGQYIWPRSANQWFSGTIATIAQNPDKTWTITDDGSNGGWRPSDPSFSGDTWVGGSSPATSYYRPTSYDCIIAFDIRDPTQQIRAHITADTDPVLDGDGSVETPGTITVEDFSDYQTARVIAAPTDAAGKRYFIIRQNDYWWGDFKHPEFSRWPDAPNGWATDEEDYGTVSSATTTWAILTSTGIANSVNPQQKFPDGKLAGENLEAPNDFLVYVDGALCRIPILSSTTDTATGKPKITFAAQAAAPLGDYTIVRSGDVAFPGRTPKCSGPFWNYGGAMDSYVVHDPNDPSPPASRAVVAAGGSFRSSDDPESTCDIDTIVTFVQDADVWSSIQDKCTTADHSFTPYIHKSIRGVQMELESVCEKFIPPLSYPVAGRNPKQVFSQAMLWDFISANNFTSTIEDKTELGAFGSSPAETEARYHFYAGTQWAGRPVVYAILKGPKYGKDQGLNRLGQLENGGVVRDDGYVDLGTGLYDAADEMSFPDRYSDVGITVYWSLGETTYRPKRYRNRYDHLAWIPDTDDGAAIYPAHVVDFAVSGSTGVGAWMKRAKSTRYMIFDDSGIASDNGEAFAVGDLAIQTGESWAYPIDPPSTSDDGTMLYWDRMSETRHQAAVQAQLDADATGIIVSHTAYSFQAGDPGTPPTVKDWWQSWFGGGEMRVNTGTLTAGGNTFFEDSSWASGENNCYVAASRFNGYAYPFENFSVEIDHDGSTYKMALTGFDPSIIRGEFADAGVAFSAGDAWRIREPGTELSRYGGIKCKVTNPDGSSFTLTAKCSDRDTAYFDPADVAAAGGFVDGARFQFDIKYPGGTDLWNGTEWTTPTGTDTRAGANGFKAKRENNSPNWVKDYGKIRKLDYNSIECWNQIQAAINALYATPTTMTWLCGRDAPISSTQMNVVTAGSGVDITGEGDGTLTYQPDVWLANLGAATQGAWDAQGDFEAGSGTEMPLEGNYSTSWSCGTGTQPHMYSIFADSHGGGFDPAWHHYDTAFDLRYNIVNEQAYSQVTDIPTILPHQTKIIAYATVDSDDHDDGSTLHIDPSTGAPETGSAPFYYSQKYVFDANGTALQYRKWVPIYTGSAVSLSTDISPTPLGDVTVKPALADTSENWEGDYDSEGTSYRGYVILDTAAWIDWRTGFQFK